MIYRLILKSHVFTYTSLFRIYRKQVIKTVPFTSDGFLSGTELLVNAIRQGYRIGEYPTILKARQYGVSKAKLLSTILAHIKFQIALLR